MLRLESFNIDNLTLRMYTLTGVGMLPPSVGLPTTKPLHCFTTAATSSMVQTSAFTLSIPTPAFEIPRLQAHTSCSQNVKRLHQ